MEHNEIVTAALNLAYDWYMVDQAYNQNSPRFMQAKETAENLARRINEEIVVPLFATFNAQAAEIERLTTAGLACAYGETAKEGEIEDYLRIMEQQAAEIERLRAEIVGIQQSKALAEIGWRAALEQAEGIRDSLVASADSIGEILFGDYADEDPTGNGNDRYVAPVQRTTEVATLHVDQDMANCIALLINEMMDVDWVHVDGETPR